MMKKNYKLVLVAVLCYWNCLAQKPVVEKVSLQDLEQKHHPADSSAAAAILYKKGEIYFDYEHGWIVKKKVKTRIKIYTKEGFEWANHSLGYDVNGDKVAYVNCNTYNLINGKIEKTTLKSDGEFIEKVNEHRRRKKITLPNIKEGCIIEFEYVVTSYGYRSTLSDWDFQTSIPVDYSEFVTTIPDYFTYKPTQKGYVFPKTRTVKTNKTISTGNDKLNLTEIETTYIAENVPALKDEVYVNNIYNYLSSISHELAMTQFPGSMERYYTLDWNSVTKKIYNYDNFGPELDKTGYFENDVTALLHGITNQTEKAKAIFNYVKSSIKWNEYNSYGCDQGVRKAYKEKTGNVADINLMLTAMLRYAGLNANPVLLSTRSNGIALHPNLSTYNYVIAAIETGNDIILLDATDKNSLPNILPMRDLNWQGRIMRKDGTSSEIDLMPKGTSKEAVNIVYQIEAGGSIFGKFRKQLTDHLALAYRQESNGTIQDTYLEALENENDKIEISDYVRENETDVSKPIIESYAFKSGNNAEVIGDKIYFSPLLFLAAESNPFKRDKREYPIDFGYPTENKYNITINIPEGYTAESVPQPITFVTEDKIGSFKYIIANTGNKIQVSIITNINMAIVSPEYYATIKDFFQKMVDKQNEKIILRKA